MEALYDRIIHNEIKMKDESALLMGRGEAAKAEAAAAGAGWLDTIMNLLPGRAKAASNEPNDEAIRRTHDHLRHAWGGGGDGRGIVHSRAQGGRRRKWRCQLRWHLALHGDQSAFAG